jgi:hypothetical protein
MMPRKTPLRPDALAIPDDVFAWFMEAGARPLDVYVQGEAGLWEVARDAVVAEWIRRHPGTRPQAWWTFDAPRWADPFDDTWFHGTLPEPRKRTGGTGDPAYECMAYVPGFRHGVPSSWLTERQAGMMEAPYNRVHDRPAVPVDPDDPPTFETEREYLARHGLLWAVEAA